MKHYLNAVLICLSLLAVACGGNEKVREHAGMKKAPVIEGVTFVHVPATTFPFNAVPTTLRTIDGSEHQFQVIQGGFWVSEEPVEPSLYEKYMGEGTWPDAGVSYDDAQAFLDKMYSKTHYPVVLLSEAMYESVLWNDAFEPERYWTEIVSDRWGDKAPGPEVEKNWKVTEGQSGLVVSRKPYERSSVEKYRRRQSNVFHICIKEAGAIPRELEVMNDPSVSSSPELSDGKDETFTIEDVSFVMKAVPGGHLTLGGTEEQEKYAEEDEVPIRDVTLRSFKIAETEVTRELWNAVMGALPSGNSMTQPKVPVGGINWYDAQRFVKRLSELTGRPFRIPSEDEWEYAARGGQKTEHYIFAGGNVSADVAVCNYKGKKGEERKGVLSDVKTLNPNELGLYDMSGNVWEWVCGAAPDGKALMHGGSYNARNTACRVSNRQPMQPEIRKGTFGFRIAL